MHVHYAVLLAASVLVSIDGATLPRDSTTSGAVSARSLSTGTWDIPAKHFLRKDKAMNTDENSENEERGVFCIACIDDFLQNKKFKSMLRTQTNAEDAYGVLKVDKVTGNLLESAEWKAWSTYVAMLNKGKADEAMVLALLSHLKPDKLSKVLAEAAKNPSTKDIATRLEKAQIKWWISLSTSYHKMDDIFKTLKLNNAANDIFESPQLSTFAKYLDAFNKKRRHLKRTLFDVFKHHYGEGGLIKLLVSAQDVKSSAGATKMLDTMLEGWLQLTKSPYSVFQVLHLDNADGDLLSNPLLSTWVRYMNQFNEYLPSRKTTMIETFLKSYGDETLTKMLEAAKKVPATEQLALNLEKAKTVLFNKWMSEGITPDYLFKNVLNLDPATMASTPHTNIWRAYYNAYDKAYPGKLFSFYP